MAQYTYLIPTYFAGQMLLNCVNSILNIEPEAKVLIYKNQIGWLKAANELIQSVSGDIILINDDILIRSQSFGAELERLAYSDPKIGIVGGKSLDATGEKVINYGIYVATDGNTAHKHYGATRDSIRQPEYQKAIEGSCAYIKRAVIEEVGLLDEAFVAYREEVDLCFRAREAGWKVISCPTAEYIHLTSQTHGRLGITNDSHEYFMEKWGKKLALGEI